MPTWMRVLIGLGIALLSCGVFLFLFGDQTFCALKARYEARQLPFVRNTPIELIDSSASRSLGQKLSYFGFEFEVPWDDIDNANSRVVGGNKAVIAFRSGNVLMVWRGSPHDLVDTIFKTTHIDPGTFRTMYGGEALASDYNFQRIMLEATPDAITPFVSKRKAIEQETLLVMKGLSAPRGAESGMFLVSAGEFKGFQFGRPSKAQKGFSVELYSATDSLDFIFAPKVNGPTPISQADVNCILQTLHRVPTDAETIKASRKIQAVIEPILDAQLAVTAQDDSQASEFRLGKRVGKVFDDRSSLADESLVVLLSFYIGEANGEDLLHQITLRGKRMLPLLAKYKDKTVVLDHDARFGTVRLPLDTRNEDFTLAIKCIREGTVWGVD